MKKESQSLFIRFVVGLIFAVLYAASALIFEKSIFVPPENAGTRFRPAIFLLAITSIIFGPIIGLITGSVGNLLFDFLADYIIKGEELNLSNIVGMIANGTAGFLLGLLAREVDIKKVNKVKEIIFSRRIFFNVLWNTILAIVFFGAYVGLVIAIGSPFVKEIEGEEFFKVAFDYFNVIFFWNGLFLLLTIPFFYLTYLILSFYGEKRKLKRVQSLKELRIIIPPGSKSKFEIISAEVIGETELIMKRWNQIRITLLHSFSYPISLTVESCSSQILQPDNITIRELKAGKKATLTFSIYPLIQGANQIKLRLVPWFSQHSIKMANIDDLVLGVATKGGFEPVEFHIGHHVNRISHTYLSQVWSFSMVSISIITFVITLQEILNQSLTFLASPEFSAILIIILMECTMVIIFYFHTKRKYQKIKEDIEELSINNPKGMDANLTDILNPIEIISSSKNFLLRTIIRIPLQLISFFGILFLCLLLFVDTVSKNDLFSINMEILPNNNFYVHIIIFIGLLIGIFVLTFLRWLEDYSIKKTTQKKTVIDHKNPLKGVITEKVIEKGKKNDLKLEIINNLTPFGLKCVISSFTHISPKVRKLYLEKGDKGHAHFELFPYTAGSDTVNINFYPIFNSKGKFINHETSLPLYKTSFIFSANNPTFLGISEKQFSKMKKNFGLSLLFITIVSVGITFLGVNFNFVEQILATILPVFLVFQVPILFIHYTLRNRLSEKTGIKL